ncbi:MAG: Holliday junction resolvase RuvX [Erysipelotrichia bacterium]|nr:Holliday junction resolvase RuvX [Erysipelotrichia bacterium]
MIKRILGLDLGSVTCGVSVSDLMGLIASPVETVRFASDDYDDCLAKLKKHIEGYKVDTVVLGLPKHMNGDIGIRGNVSLAFKEKLEALGLQVILWDERLTTVSAERFLLEADMSRKKRKKVIDQMAAVTILQDYLNSKQ